MASLTNHTLLNGLEENLKNSIEFVGGVVPEDTCAWQYPEIIKQQLTSNSLETGHVIAGEGIKVEKTAEGYVVSADVDLTQDAEKITIDHIDAPSWARGLDENAWESGTSLQKLLEDLFDNVLPNVPSVTKGDIITTDANGKDPFAPEELPEYIDALKPSTQYLRLFLISQQTPIYISLEEIANTSIDLTDYFTKEEVNRIINNSLSGYYTKGEVDGEIQSLNSTIEKQTTQISEITQKVDNFISNESVATPEEADVLFDSIFKN